MGYKDVVEVDASNGIYSVCEKKWAGKFDTLTLYLISDVVHLAIVSSPAANLVEFGSQDD